MSDAQQTAEFLHRLYLSQEKCEAIPVAFRPKSKQAAYDGQHLLVEKLLSANEGGVIGYKCACTSEHAQMMLKVDGPFYGQMLDWTTWESGVTLSADVFNHRVMEPEFGFRIDKDVPMLDGGFSAETILPYIGDCMPALEIVDHRFEDFTTVGGDSLIAHNAVHGGVVFGAPVSDWRHFDLSAHGVTMRVNGEVNAVGSGLRVLGNPLNVIAWLFNELQSQGRTLHAGDRLITGVATNTYRAQKGDLVSAEFGELGSVTVTFE